MITGKITMANKEVIPFELYEEDAPITVANFVKLIKEGYYNGKTFHRVIPGFVSQGGCPFGNGTGDLGYTIPCETANNPHRHVHGSPRKRYRMLSVFYCSRTTAASGRRSYSIRPCNIKYGSC